MRRFWAAVRWLRCVIDQHDDAALAIGCCTIIGVNVLIGFGVAYLAIRCVG